ncbi:uncharacterized protein BO66DRAFT_395967, partial [Aspergillus aculeatinus CBS 121060]
MPSGGVWQSVTLAFPSPLLIIVSLAPLDCLATPCLLLTCSGQSCCRAQESPDAQSLCVCADAKL